MLCEFANTFPARVAALLERDRELTRNFREESITDVLMAGLVGLEPFGIKVDFPDEPTTGGDMEWIYVARPEDGGGCYLRLIFQAKRAKFVPLKKGGYWWYQHLDHGTPAGKQAKTLLAQATSSTLPLYIFYHPTSALKASDKGRPAIAGVNIVFASKIAPLMIGGGTRSQKKLEFWRNDFMPLSDFLCWPVISGPGAPLSGATSFLQDSAAGPTPSFTSTFHPDLVALRLNRQRDAASDISLPKSHDIPIIKASSGIPDHIQRAIDGRMTIGDRRRLKRPRVLLSTNLTRENPLFENLRERLR